MAASQKPNTVRLDQEDRGPLRVVGYEPGALDVVQGRPEQVVITFILSRELDTYEQYWADVFAGQRDGYIRVESNSRATTVAAFASGIEAWVRRINEQLTEIEAEGARSRQVAETTIADAEAVLDKLTFD
jgi:hypothetical protein